MASDEIGFVDGIVAAVSEIVATGTTDLHSSVQDILAFAIEVSLRTPYPTPRSGFFFGEPTTEQWLPLFRYYNDVVLPITILLIGSALAIILFTGTFGTLLSGYERSRGKRRLFIGFLFVLAWWGAGSLVLRFADALTLAIAPDPTSLATNLSDALTLGSNGRVLNAALVAAEGAVVLGVLLWFLLRWIGIFAFMLGMPIAVAIWMVGVGGPLRYVADIAEGLAMKFVPLVLIPVPVAIIYRVGDLLLVTVEGLPSIARFALGLGFPLLSLVVSYYFFFRSPDLSGGRAAAERVEQTAIQTGRELGERLPSPGGRQTIATGRGESGGAEAVDAPAAPAAAGGGAGGEGGGGTAAAEMGAADVGGPTAPDSAGASSDVRSYEDPETARDFGARPDRRLRRDLRRSRDKIRRLRRQNP